MFIGLDIGTSGCKAAVLDAGGRITASASRCYSLIHPRLGWVELNPEVVWQAVVEVLRDLAPHAGGVRALSASSIGESVVLADAEDNLLYNAITYVDNRCEDSVPFIRGVIPERELHHRTGMPLNQMYTLNKLLWLRQHHPDMMSRVRKILLFVEYFCYRLAGRRLADPASASRTLMFDARKLDWSSEVINAFGIDRSLFADIAPTGTPVGEILPAVVEGTGLPRGIQVMLGGHDQLCCLLGSGAIDAGATLMTEGSSEGLNMVLEKKHLTDMLLDNHIAYEPYVEGRYFGTMGQLTHGHAIHWFLQTHRQDILAQRENEAETVYQVAERLLASETTPLYFLPYLSGVDPHDADNDAKGCFIGLDVTVDIWRMYRAVLEGLAFETRTRLEQMAKTGVEPRTVAAAGGGARSRKFMQLKADVVRRPVGILESDEAGIVGLGMICAVATGAYPDHAAAASRFVAIRETLSPETDYAAQYRRYLVVRDHLRALYRDLRGK